MTHCHRCGKDNPAEIHTCTPRALVLADELLDGMNDEHWNQLNADAAAELRRLYEAHEWQYTMAGERLRRIEKDQALLRQALEVMEESHYAVADTAPHADVMAHYAVIEALRERLGVTDEKAD